MDARRIIQAWRQAADPTGGYLPFRWAREKCERDAFGNVTKAEYFDTSGALVGTLTIKRDADGNELSREAKAVQ